MDRYVVIVEYPTSLFACNSVLEEKKLILLFTLGTLRGGARHSKKSSSIGRVSSSKSRRHREEEEDDDDDDEAEDVHEEEEEEEDYESDRINIRGKRHGKSKGKLPTRKSKSSGSGKGSKFQLVPWGSRNQSNQKKKKGPSLKERLEQLAKQGHTAYNEVYRRAKVECSISSSFFYYHSLE